jgi:hypothetical protein
LTVCLFYLTSENQVATPTGTTEVIIPCNYIGFVCGNNGSEIEEIEKVHSPFLYLSNIQFIYARLLLPCAHQGNKDMHTAFNLYHRVKDPVTLPVHPFTRM